MAFQSKNKDAANSKQHLNLSLYAYEIVENDRFTFDEKLSGYFTVHRHRLNSTFLSLERMRRSYRRLF